MTTITPDTEDTASSNTAGGGTGGFLKRLFLAFIKVTLVFLVLAGLAIGAWFLFVELNRSFDSVIVRIDRNTRRIEDSETEIDALLEQNYARQVQIGELEADLASREKEIAALKEELGASLDRQATMLGELEEQAAALTDQTGALGDETVALGAGLAALQEDLNANGQEIDQLGGDVDGLGGELATLDGRAADLQGQIDDLAAEELAGWRRAVALFRVWQTIGRARLRLIENDFGLAAADIDLAIAAMDDLLASETEQPPDDLIAIRERLALAAASLPDQPPVAGRDLETAWEALDLLVGQAVTREQSGE